MQTNSSIDGDLEDHLPPIQISVLFNLLNANNIEWCSWKSNQHLEPGLKGKTDLDLMFHTSDRFRVTKLMQEAGFILYETAYRRAYPGMLDFISCDPETGNILHVHSHFLLPLGEKNIKSFIFDWNKHILRKRIQSEEYENAYIADPTTELVLLCIRYALKIRWRDNLSINPKIKDNGFWKEFYWLKNDRAKLDDCYSVATSLLDDKAAGLVVASIKSNASFKSLLDLRRYIYSVSYKKNWRRMPKYKALFSMWFNELVEKSLWILEKSGLQQTRIIRRRTLPCAGLVVAFVGSDGAGKSTVTKTITKEWGYKLDVPLFYLGTGEGQRGIYAICLNLFLSFLRKVKYFANKVTPVNEFENAEKDFNFDVYHQINLVKIITAIVSVLEKKRTLKKIKKLKEKGYLIITDRWPQNQIMGINDGPLLSLGLHHSNKFIRTISSWEANEFEKIVSLIQPDLILKLTVTLQNAAARKVEHEQIIPLIKSKITALENLSFAEETKVKVIDANKSVGLVLIDVRKEIIDLLRHQRFQSPLFIECFGLPGSGKSTLTRAMVTNSDYKNYRTITNWYVDISPFKRFLLITKTVVFEPYLYYLIMKFIGKNKIFSFDSILILMKLPAHRKKVLERIRRNSGCISEQLFLQAIWSVFLSARVQCVDRLSLLELLSAIYSGMNFRVITFNASPEIVSHRIYLRKDGRSRFDNLSRADIKLKLEQQQWVFNEILYCAKVAGIDLVYIDASLGIDDSYKQVMGYL